MDEDRNALYFQILLEAGIISQIGRAFLERRLPDGLLVSHFGVLNHLIRVADGCTPLVLARAFQVPKTTMTHTLAGLERHGFVVMRQNPDDRRSKRVWLTAAGRSFVDAAVGAMAPVFDILAERYAPRDAQALLPEITRFREIIDRIRDEID